MVLIVNLSQATPAIDFQELTTPKGLKLLFSENHDTEYVSVHIAFKDSVVAHSASKEQDLALLTSRMLQVTAETRLQAIISHHNVRLKFYPCEDRDYFTIELSTPTKKLPETLSLVVNFLLSPNLNEEIFKTALEAQKAIVKNQREDPMLLTSYDFFRLTSNQFKKNSFSPGIRMLENISSKEVADYIKQHFTQDRIVISVAGSIQVDRLIKLVDVTLGKLPVKSKKKLLKNEQNKTSYQEKNNYVFMDFFGSVIYLGLPWIEKSHSDYGVAKLFKTQLDILIMSKFKEEFGTENLRNNRYQPDDKHQYLLLSGWLYTDNHNTPKGIRLIKEIFRAVKIQGIDQSFLRTMNDKFTLDSLKKHFIEEITLLLDEIKLNNNMTAYYLFCKQTNKLGWLTDPNMTIAQLKAVKPIDIDRFAYRMLHPDELYWVEVGRKNHLNT